MKKTIISLFIFLSFFLPLQINAQAISNSYEQTNVQQQIDLIKSLILMVQQAIEEILKNQQTILQSNQPVYTYDSLPVVNISKNPATELDNLSKLSEPEQLTFIRTPKLVFKNELLSYITWETNRPTKLLVSPIFPDKDGWTTSLGAWGSCGRANVSYNINSDCKIVVIDDNGNKLEYLLKVFVDRDNN